MINYELRPRGLLVVVHGCKCIYYIPRAPELDAQRVHEELERPLGRRLQGVWAPRLESEARRANQYLGAGTAAAKLRHRRCPTVSSLCCVVATTLLRKHQRQHGADPAAELLSLFRELVTEAVEAS